MTVEDRDLGYRDFVLGIGRVNGAGVLVGVRASKGVEVTESGASLVTIAAVNEFGSADGRVPERSYLRSTVDENATRYTAELARVIRATLDRPAALRRGLERVGHVAVSDVQRKITDLRDPPNAPRTVARKGSDNPLIDTGRLRASIDFEVEGA